MHGSGYNVWIVPGYDLTQVSGRQEANLGVVVCGWSDPLVIEASELRTIGRLSVFDNASRVELLLPSLLSVDGDLYFGNNRASLDEESPPVIIEAPDLTTIGGSLDVHQNGARVELLLPSLFSLGGSLRVEHNERLYNPNMVRDAGPVAIDLPALEEVVEDVRVVSNASLASLSLPAIRALGEFYVAHSNAHLPQCQVDALEQQLRGAGWQGTAHTGENDETGTCP